MIAIANVSKGLWWKCFNNIIKIHPGLYIYIGSHRRVEQTYLKPLLG
jgi:hypothetical protein